MRKEQNVSELGDVVDTNESRIRDGVVNETNEPQMAGLGGCMASGNGA